MENTVALNHSPSIVRDGLVFYYDMANTQKSWRGKPTTNYISNPTEEMPRGEFGQYRDLAPIFDTYGLVPYSLSMDIKVSKPGNVLVYMQNGSSTKYGFVGADVNATTEYQRFYFNNITPAISTPSDTAATLATYTGYGSGVNPTVKNIQLELGTFATPFVAGTRSNTQAVIDLIGNNTITANSLTYASDGTFRFDGGQHMSIPNSPVFNMTSGLTIETWVKFDGNSDDFIFEKGDVNTQYSLFSHSTDIVFRTYHSGDGGYHTQDLQKSAVGISNGVWVHIVGSWDGSYKRIFVNGELKNEIAKSGALVTTSKGSSVGRFGGDTTGYYFNGSIPKIAVYNRGLSAAEVQQNFNAQRGRYGL